MRSGGAKRLDVVLPAGIILLIAGVWVPQMDRAFGPTHEGIVSSRFALHARAFDRAGLVGSDLLASMEPYGGAYAHHPPLPNFVQAAVSAMAGVGEWQTRLFPTITGLTAVAAVWGLLRVLHVRRGAAAIAAGVIISSPMFWHYARLLWDFPLLFIVPALTVAIDRAEHRPRGSAVAAFSVLCALSVLSSYIAGAFAVACWLWLLWRSRSRLDQGWVTPTTVWPATTATAAGVITGAWLLSAGSTEELSTQVAFRVSEGQFGIAGFVGQQIFYAGTMFGPVLLALAVIGLVRTRQHALRRHISLVTTAVGVAFVVALPNGSFVHEYWSYPLLVPLSILVGSGVESIAETEIVGRRPGLVTVSASLAVLGLVAATVVGPKSTSMRGASAAGDLAQTVDPPVSQSRAWTNATTPRWLSYYWDLPAGDLSNDVPAVANPSDLALLNRSEVERLGVTESEVVAENDDFAVIRMAALLDE